MTDNSDYVMVERKSILKQAVVQVEMLKLGTMIIAVERDVDRCEGWWCV